MRLIPRRRRELASDDGARGQALAEFALVIPLLLVMVIGVLDLGRVIWALDSVSNAAREGARFAIVRGGSIGMVAAAPVSAIRDRANAAAVAAGSNVTVTVCYGSTEPTTSVAPDECTSDINTGASSYARGTPVTVVVRGQLQLVAPALLGMSNFTVTGSSVMVVSN